MDIGVDQGQPSSDIITLFDGSNRFRDPVTGTFMIDRFNLSFDQYRNRRRLNMTNRAYQVARKLYPDKYQDNIQLDRPPLEDQHKVVSVASPPAPNYNGVYLGVLLILLSLTVGRFN